MKKLCTTLAAALLAVTLAACGGSGLTTFDATAYTQGLLDKTYLGVFDQDYLDMVDIDEEEAMESYQTSLEVEYAYLSKNLSFEEDYLTDETRQAALDVIADMYQNARYEVKPATKTDKGFAIEVVVQPYDLIAVINEDYMADYAEGFRTKYASYTEEVINAMSDSEYRAFMIEHENDWANGVLALFRDNASAGGHLDSQSIIVQMTKTDKGYYAISENDFANLDALILAYTR